MPTRPYQSTYPKSIFLACVLSYFPYVVVLALSCRTFGSLFFVWEKTFFSLTCFSLSGAFNSIWSKINIRQDSAITTICTCSPSQIHSFSPKDPIESGFQTCESVVWGLLPNRWNEASFFSRLVQSVPTPYSSDLWSFTWYMTAPPEANKNAKIGTKKSGTGRNKRPCGCAESSDSSNSKAPFLL